MARRKVPRSRAKDTTKEPLDLEFGVDPKERRDYRWPEVAEALRANPMEWAVVHRDIPASQVWSVQQGRVRAVHPSLGFEAKGRETYRPPGESTPRTAGQLLMRYNPDLDTSRAKKNGRKK